VVVETTVMLVFIHHIKESLWLWYQRVLVVVETTVMLVFIHHIKESLWLWRQRLCWYLYIILKSPCGCRDNGYAGIYTSY
jgi:hypothetical protein